ncbi:hypothetical protein V6N12_002974 [Hibiscus sabdariffa]|uniref:Uncharacterized protein n=1 Tax=Hibiscus sabdariffa TaxID=183260 RepID=A0ABR2EAJ4_9ROSI
MGWIWVEAALPLGIVAALWAMLSISSTNLIMDGQSTSGTICGTLPWKEGIRSSWKISLPPIDLFLV